MTCARIRADGADMSTEGAMGAEDNHDRDAPRTLVPICRSYP